MFRCFNSNRLRKYSNDEIISIYATLKYDYFYRVKKRVHPLIEVGGEFSLFGHKKFFLKIKEMVMFLSKM